MRRRSLLIAAVTTVFVAGCSGRGGTDSAAAGDPVSGGTLTWGIETEPITLNPHQYAQAKARLLVWNNFESLLTHDDKGGYVPLLASGSAASPDGWSSPVKLRTVVTFSDGTA